MKVKRLPRQEDVQETELDGLPIKFVRVTAENAESSVEAALALKIGESCRYCLHKYTSVEDLRAREVVFAGKHEHGTLACKSCWQEHNSG